MAEVPTEDQPMTVAQDARVDQELPIDADEADAGTVLDDKITILKGYASDMSAVTFCLFEEDHTLGNSLRWMLMKNPQVEFCGYSNPHPSEPKIHLRVQMYDGASALTAVREALTNLEDLFLAIDSSYSASLDKGNYDRSEEIGTSAQELRDIVDRGNEVRQAQLDAERAKRAGA